MKDDPFPLVKINVLVILNVLSPKLYSAETKWMDGTALAGSTAAHKWRLDGMGLKLWSLPLVACVDVVVPTADSRERR